MHVHLRACVRVLFSDSRCVSVCLHINASPALVTSTGALTEIRPYVHSWRPQLPRPLTPWKWNEYGWAYTCTHTMM